LRSGSLLAVNFCGFGEAGQRWLAQLKPDPLDGGKSVLEALGNIGDFVGGIAVILTLIYLAVQIRDNTRSTRLVAMQSAMLSAQNVGKLPAQDRDLARVVRVGLAAPDDLDEDEFQQLRYYLMSYLRVHEDLFVQHKAGVIDDETWLARASSLRTIFSTPGGRKIWDASNAYRPDFQAWMNSHLDRDGPPTV
jgi:hypothetical protein